MSDDLDELYAKNRYIDAYATHTDLRVGQDPKEAVGGDWDELGELQISYLKSRGLRPEHSLLDIGCGTLRAGRHFISYLKPTNYTGFELSPKALEYAKSLVASEGLLQKRPSLILNTSRTLTFAEFGGRKYDYLLAQSVFTHLPAYLISECFAYVGSLMHQHSIFLFTFNEGTLGRIGHKGFRQPFYFYEQLATSHNFVIARRHDYAHPRGQAMAMLTLPAEPSFSDLCLA
jgi:SAM-dependent methyltransferase